MKNARQNAIIDLLARDGRVKTVELQQLFNVSVETIRRDFHQLEQDGVLIKTYGGAVLAGQNGFIETKLPSWKKRSTRLVSEKRAIADRALDFVNDSCLLALDSGTTTFEVARLLKTRNQLTVITNDLHAASEIEEKSANSVFLLGGALTENLSTSGHLAKEYLNSFSQLDLFIMGCDGVTAEDGLTTTSLENNELKRLLAEKALYKVAVVDHSKFGRKALFKICDLTQVDLVITDSGTPADYLETLRQRGVRVEVVEADPDRADAEP